MFEFKITDTLHEVRFPGGGEAYRRACDELLGAEIQLRESIEEMAALRRDLPLGGALKQDYVFEEVGGSGTQPGAAVRLSELFQAGKNSLILYSFMYGPNADPCPMCNSFLDGLDGYAPHITQRVNLAVVARSSPRRIVEWSRSRGWKYLRLLSSGKTATTPTTLLKHPRATRYRPATCSRRPRMESAISMRRSCCMYRSRDIRGTWTCSGPSGTSSI